MTSGSPTSPTSPITPDTLVGAVATEHPLATRVFARHGIDFCCGGGRPLREACADKGLEPDVLVSELKTEIEASPEPERRWDEAPFDELIDHIVGKYHMSLREELPRLEAMARKVNEVHGDKDPENLRGILDTFIELRAELVDHMAKEEQILFPMIRAGRGGMAQGPVNVMEHEHASAGIALSNLRRYTNDYTVPEGACTTWTALWHGLAALESELHEHIHLENNILFPRALKQ
ncbi:MAG: iron-sulfur cluster repair di-iron protein [Planctomycetota bacterium]|jgi:regulator of cell morphogenesis and NO signaling